MFNWFNKKEKQVKVTDLVWINDVAKKAGLIELIQQKPNALLCAWFTDTVADMKDFLNEKLPGKNIYRTKELHNSVSNGKELIFLEHYPLFTKEQTFFNTLNAAEITVISSLEDPLFRLFNSTNLSDILRRMGVDETEALSHKMITASIANAQKKLEDKLSFVSSVDTAKDWYRINKPAD